MKRGGREHDVCPVEGVPTRCAHCECPECRGGRGSGSPKAGEPGFLRWRKEHESGKSVAQCHGEVDAEGDFRCYDHGYDCPYERIRALEAELELKRVTIDGLQDRLGAAARAAEKAEAEVERLKAALLRIVRFETQIHGLRPEFYGHAQQIAQNALSEGPDERMEDR